MKKIIIMLLIILILLFSFVSFYKTFFDRPAFESVGTVKLFLDGIKDNEYEHIYRDGNIYISALYLKDNEFLDYYWDKEYNKISIFNNFGFEVINYNKEKAFINSDIQNLEDKLIIDIYNITDLFIEEENELYFNAMFLSSNYIENMYIDKNRVNVIIEKNTKEYIVVKQSSIKEQPYKPTTTLKNLDVGDNVFIYDNEYDGWILARTKDNIIGYIKLSDINPVSKINYNRYFSLNKGKTINMAWDLIFNPIVNFKPFNIPDSIDIIAPTWFDLEDTEEYFKDLSNNDYIEYVHKSGKEIWAVFNNSFDPELTHKLLNDGIKRSEIIDKILDITIKKNFDAINIDFENIYLEDKDVFSAFVKELYCKAKHREILMTIDITILSKSENWSLFYDREVVGKYSDYIMLMAYDENVSKVPGSVSSLPWVEYGVNNILEYALREKVVLSIPFYTRLWEESIIEDDLNVKVTALRIKTAESVIEELEIELEYDEKTGQNYGQTTIDGITYSIWNEDGTSFLKRLEIVKRYNLAGHAIWALDYGTEEIWRLME